jgi:hypothetical protein
MLEIDIQRNNIDFTTIRAPTASITIENTTRSIATENATLSKKLKKTTLSITTFSKATLSLMTFWDIEIHHYN